VLPIKRFALIQSDVLIDVIKKMIYEIRRMAQTSAKSIDKTAHKGLSIIALGATTLRNVECNF
jgi:S-adenosylmethionine:tRNA-ribosyltransferase-isomerase (queuine synthetase)